MADGKISSEEADELRTALIADGQITPDEVEVIRTVMREQLGDGHLEFE
jgi:tellurite resistance protein